MQIDADSGKGKDDVEIEIAIQYAGEETQIYSFVNAIPTPLGGTHVAAFKAGLTKAVKQFATSKKLIKGEDDVRGDDALLGPDRHHQSHHDRHAPVPLADQRKPDQPRGARPGASRPPTAT